MGARPVIGAAAVLAVLAGCGGDGGPRRLQWTIEFADGTVREQARAVEALILPGGCGAPESDAVYRASVRRTGAGVVMEPPELGPGLWGFAARARDGTCRVVGYGCAMITLEAGAQASVTTVIVARAEVDPGCEAAQCDDGVCGGSDAGLDDAGPDAPPPLDTGCVDGTRRCTGDTFTECIGGTPVDSPCPLGCAPTADRCARVLPSNVDPSLLGGEPPPITIDVDTRIDTTMCVTPISEARVAMMAAGGEACVLVAGGLEISATLSATGSRPLIILATGPVLISGAVDLAARGRTPGAGGGAGGVAASAAGPAMSAGGPAPGLPGVHGGAGDDTGGGGGGHCGSGGPGGGTPGVVMGGRGGAGPTLPAMSLLEPLAGGSGGGPGGFAAPTLPADGGGGGGAVQITSLVSIEVGGTVDVSGGGGRPGHFMMSSSGGGGGGSGGAVLLEAPVVTIGGEIRALGGGGGGAASTSSMMDGSAGTDGVAAMMRASGGAPASSDDGAGGAGGGADILDGDPGQNTPAPPGNSGGGGGGAGCIVIRTATGERPAGSFNPSLSPGVQVARVRTE